MYPRRVYGLGDVARYQVTPYGLLEGPVQDDVDVLHRAREEARVQAFAVKGLEVQRVEFVELHPAQGRDDYNRRLQSCSVGSPTPPGTRPPIYHPDSER